MYSEVRNKKKSCQPIEIQRLIYDFSFFSANLKEYLLEKSRVVCHNNDEGNFHIFYYLFAGLSHEVLLRNGLRIASDHR